MGNKKSKIEKEKSNEKKKKLPLEDLRTQFKTTFELTNNLKIKATFYPFRIRFINILTKEFISEMTYNMGETLYICDFPKNEIRRFFE